MAEIKMFIIIKPNGKEIEVRCISMAHERFLKNAAKAKGWEVREMPGKDTDGSKQPK